MESMYYRKNIQRQLICNLIRSVNKISVRVSSPSYSNLITQCLLLKKARPQKQAMNLPVAIHYFSIGKTHHKQTRRSEDKGRNAGFASTRLLSDQKMFCSSRLGLCLACA